MHTTTSLIDAIAKKLQCNDSEVSRQLGMTRSGISHARSRGSVFDEDSAKKAAEILGLPVDEVLLDIQVERAAQKNPELRRIWERIAKKYKTIAATMTVLVVNASPLHHQPAASAAVDCCLSVNSAYYVK
jgi:transcriptional regulator with XRE-family HTH domain